ncbi:hypothetical protein ABTZ99_11650 [Actinosynnema sp. NPDC002837]
MKPLPLIAVQEIKPLPDRLQVLSTIYQADRADRATTFNVSLATMAAAVTYLVGTVAFYDKLDLLGWVISLLPFPLICVAAFHTMLVNLAAVRARSILHLERHLLDSVDTSLERAVVGATATESHTNIHTAAAYQRVAILIAYGGVGVVHVGYAVLMLWKAARHLSGWVAVPAVVYAALLALIGIAWKEGLARLDFRDEVGDRATA